MKRKKDQMALHLMMLPGMILLAIFSFTPMFGIIMAFQNYMPARGIAKSPWVGMDNFIFMFQMPDSKQIFINTITIAVGKLNLDGKWIEVLLNCGSEPIEIQGQGEILFARRCEGNSLDVRGTLIRRLPSTV